MELDINKEIETNDIIFRIGKEHREILKLTPDGDIYVDGKKLANDKEIREGIKNFIKGCLDLEKEAE